MKLPKRFALSTLLLAMFFASLVFGYAQWRRQRIVAAVAELKEFVEPALVPELNDNPFWPTVSPNQVTLSFTKNIRGEFVRNGRTYSYEEMLSHVTMLRDKFRAADVRGVYLQLHDERGNVFSWDRVPFDVGQAW
jgi:hypothetical protein